MARQIQLSKYTALFFHLIPHTHAHSRVVNACAPVQLRSPSFTRQAPGCDSCGASAATLAGWSAPNECEHALHLKCRWSASHEFASTRPTSSQARCCRAHASEHGSARRATRSTVATAPPPEDDVGGGNEASASPKVDSPGLARAVARGLSGVGVL